MSEAIYKYYIRFHSDQHINIRHNFITWEINHLAKTIFIKFF